MAQRKTGKYLTISTVGESVKAFVPDPLPPKPALEVSPSLRDAMDQAHLELGRLDGITTILPDTSLFLYMYIRKEAVLSSQIEGTQSSLSDLLLFEMDGAPGVPLDDVREVSNYVAAMEHGLKRLRGGFPLCNRLICEIHGKLLSKGRGAGKKPGEFRTSQNWIGGTRPGNARFVPPPPGQLADCLGAFEKFLNDDPERTPTLLKAALAHVQFETIHPFLDGNGRLGRLLITLLLCHEKVMREPLLYLSLYFKEHRNAYYDHLQQVRNHGDWESWAAYFMDAIGQTSRQAVSTANRLSEIIRKDRIAVQSLGRISGSAYRVFDLLAERPLLSIPVACRRTGMVPNTVTKVMGALQTAGIVKEITGQKRNRLFRYDRYMKVLTEGTEPLS
jgi:Fic family protein